MTNAFAGTTWLFMGAFQWIIVCDQSAGGRKREWGQERGKEWQTPWRPHHPEPQDGMKIVKLDYAAAFHALLIG